MKPGIEAAVRSIDQDLRLAAGEDPLGALARIRSIRSLLAERELEAVRSAVADCSWREIGEALGVSKQAAFQRFGKEWVIGLRASLPRKQLHEEVRRRLGG